jgi:hypothetical protein
MLEAMLMRDEEMLIPIVAILMPLILVPTIIKMKHAHRLKEWAHKERMRAMELGLAPPTSMSGTFWPSLAAIAIGAGVPIGAFFFAWMANLTSHVGEEAFLVAGGVGFAAVISGAMLASKLIGGAHCGHAPAEPPSFAKPSEYDPDAYDTVGRRG